MPLSTLYCDSCFARNRYFDGALRRIDWRFFKGNYRILRRLAPVERVFYARTGTLAVRSSLPQLTHAPLTARRIAFQIQ
jgi:hypothetical protein